VAVNAAGQELGDRCPLLIGQFVSVHWKCRSSLDLHRKPTMRSSDFQSLANIAVVTMERPAPFRSFVG
jgi:hypothetical protein